MAQVEHIAPVAQEEETNLQFAARMVRIGAIGPPTTCCICDVNCKTQGLVVMHELNQHNMPRIHFGID